MKGINTMYRHRYNFSPFLIDGHWTLIRWNITADPTKEIVRIATLPKSDDMDKRIDDYDTLLQWQNFANSWRGRPDEDKHIRAFAEHLGFILLEEPQDPIDPAIVDMHRPF